MLMSKIKNHFQDSRFLIQIILDGYGIGKEDNTNAIYKANTPYMDWVSRKYASTKLYAHGPFVGLPNNKDLGGSEVGHSTIGAGKINLQLPSMIQKKIQNGSFENSSCLKKTFSIAKKGALHLIGLLSDGNIHSHIDHLIAIIHAAEKNAISNCYLHALLDGRDTPIQSALIFTEKIEALFSKINKRNKNFNYSFASAGGREYTTMDRAKNWYLIARGWNLHIKGIAKFSFASIKEGIEYFRKKKPSIIDQDIPAFNILHRGKSITVKDGDALFSFNFRGDRMREFSSIWEEENFSHFSLEKKPKIFFSAMTVYDQDKNQPKNRIIEIPPKKNFLEKG